MFKWSSYTRWPSQSQELRHTACHSWQIKAHSTIGFAIFVIAANQTKVNDKVQSLRYDGGILYTFWDIDRDKPQRLHHILLSYCIPGAVCKTWRPKVNCTPTVNIMLAQVCFDHSAHALTARPQDLDLCYKRAVDLVCPALPYT